MVPFAYDSLSSLTSNSVRRQTVRLAESGQDQIPGMGVAQNGHFPSLPIRLSST